MTASTATEVVSSPTVVGQDVGTTALRQIAMVEVTLRLPDDVARSFGDKPADVARRLLEDAAIEGYRSGRLSHRQVGCMLSLDYWQAEAFFATRRVPLNYSVADLEADSLALTRVLDKP